MGRYNLCIRRVQRLPVLNCSRLPIIYLLPFIRLPRSALFRRLSTVDPDSRTSGPSTLWLSSIIRHFWITPHFRLAPITPTWLSLACPLSCSPACPLTVVVSYAFCLSHCSIELTVFTVLCLLSYVYTKLTCSFSDSILVLLFNFPPFTAFSISRCPRLLYFPAVYTCIRRVNRLGDSGRCLPK